MLPEFIRKERFKIYKNLSISKTGKYVLYFMEASQRTKHNYALETAVYLANLFKKPLVVFFSLTDKYKYSNLRYYTFMIEGILKVKERLKERGIKLVIQKVEPPQGVISLAKDAILLVMDKSYLRHQRSWREKILKEVEIPVVEVEGEVVCPLEVVSKKLIPYARFIRPKLFSSMFYFLEDLPEIELKNPSLNFDLESWDEATVKDYLNKLDIDRNIPPVDYFKGGEDEAEKRLHFFLTHRLSLYADYRLDPGVKATSELSPYLRFGQISPVQIIKELLRFKDLKDKNVQSFLNELLVWRELARNYVWYNPFYDQYEGLPLWARKTLGEHLKDEREIIYSVEILEKAETHDPYWNAAQKELLKYGKIHNYIRMYWCKKLIEWTKDPQEAFNLACYFNDKYALDGRDPNGYLGISWCFGAFDRPFSEKPIYGKVRKMTSKSLLSKSHFFKYLKEFL